MEANCQMIDRHGITLQVSHFHASLSTLHDNVALFHWLFHFIIFIIIEILTQVIFY